MQVMAMFHAEKIWDHRNFHLIPLLIARVTDIPAHCHRRHAFSAHIDAVLQNQIVVNHNHTPRAEDLCDKGAGGRALVSPGGREDTDGLVVTGETVDTGLDENKAELAVLVLSVALEVLPDGDGLVTV